MYTSTRKALKKIEVSFLWIILIQKTLNMNDCILDDDFDCYFIAA